MKDKKNMNRRVLYSLCLFLEIDISIKFYNYYFVAYYGINLSYRDSVKLFIFYLILIF